MDVQSGVTPLMAAALGAVQGLTEYLPVSSSGHLVIAQSLFGLTAPELLFDIILHLGTLTAVAWFYRKELYEIIAHSWHGARRLAGGAAWSAVMTEYPGFRWAWLIVVGSVPTGIIGVLFEKKFEELFSSPGIVGAMLMVTASFLYATRWFNPTHRGIEGMRWWEAVLIGVAQGLAITPGISRSGATICAALLLGIERETSARYSFLLSIPAVAGALLLGLHNSWHAPSAAAMGIGFTMSLAVGYASLALLVAMVKRGRLPWFSCYLFPVGALVIFFL